MSAPMTMPGSPTAANVRWTPTKYVALSPPTGETFELVASARTAADGMYRFVWTLAPGKRGPGEHIHETETEHFAIVSGTLRIWLSGVPKDYVAGDVVSIPPNVPHKFLNPGTEPVVVNVSLTGPLMEVTFAPIAVAAHARGKPTLGDFARMVVTIVEDRPSLPTSAMERGMIIAIAGALKLFGVKRFERVHGWDAQ